MNVAALLKALTRMSRINTNVASLIARRALGISNESLNQVLERISPRLRINRGTDAPADIIAELRGLSGAFQKYTLATRVNSLQVVRENVTAAESAIRDADFAVVTSNLTQAQILVDKVSRLRAGDRPDGQADELPGGFSAQYWDTSHFGWHAQARRSRAPACRDEL